MEPEDSEDELGDGLEDSCSHDENEEEEGEEGRGPAACSCRACSPSTREQG